MKELVFNHNFAVPFLRPNELELLAPQVAVAHRQLHEGTGAGSDFWVGRSAGEIRPC